MVAVGRPHSARPSTSTSLRHNYHRHQQVGSRTASIAATYSARGLSCDGGPLRHQHSRGGPTTPVTSTTTRRTYVVPTTAAGHPNIELNILRGVDLKQVSVDALKRSRTPSVPSRNPSRQPSGRTPTLLGRRTPTLLGRVLYGVLPLFSDVSPTYLRSVSHVTMCYCRERCVQKMCREIRTRRWSCHSTYGKRLEMSYEET